MRTRGSSVSRVSAGLDVAVYEQAWPSLRATGGPQTGLVAEQETGKSS